jgi:hypothetical protein
MHMKIPLSVCDMHIMVPLTSSFTHLDTTDFIYARYATDCSSFVHEDIIDLLSYVHQGNIDCSSFAHLDVINCTFM